MMVVHLSPTNVVIFKKHPQLNYGWDQCELSLFLLMVVGREGIGFIKLVVLIGVIFGLWLIVVAFTASLRFLVTFSLSLFIS